MATIFIVLLVLVVSSCHAISNETNTTMDMTNATNSSVESGSGMSCKDIQCNGGGSCIDMGVPICICPAGKRLVGYYDCEDCLIGKWGIECNQTCSDNCGGKGRIKSCDPVDGTCVCNDCWLLEGNMCTKVAGNMTGYQCFVDYLKSITKSLDLYGGDIPVPADEKLSELAKHLTNSAIVQEGSGKLTVIDREDVSARDLARLSFTVPNQGGADYDSALNTIKERVKNGLYRGTLVIDESDGNTAKVTVNV